MSGLQTQLHVIRVKVLRGLNPFECLEILEWTGLSNEMLIKWRWYFEYRQALLKVKYPKLKVEMSDCVYQPETLCDKEIVAKKLRNKLIAKKRKITEFTRKMNHAKDNWNELFPIEENPVFLKVSEKLNRLICERDELIEIINRLKPHTAGEDAGKTE